MEKMNELNIGLHDPGMTHVHRVGLAGLYMTLQHVGEGRGSFEGLGFELASNRITIRWRSNGRESFDKLFRRAFGTTKASPSGLIDFAAHQGLGMGDLQRYELNQAVLGSFLQHNKKNNIPKGTKLRAVSVTLEDKQVVMEYRPLVKPYAHALEAKSVVDDKGRPKERIPVKGWLYPGSAERHSTLSGTEMEETPERFLCLLFTPVASLYFKLFHKGSDGKFDKRRSTAVCFPHITDLKNYARCYERYLRTPVQRLSADGLGDAGLSALVLLKADDSVDKLGITGCTVLTMGTVPWSKQQRTRTGVSLLEDIRESVLETFDLACRCLPNRVVVKEPKTNATNSGTERGYFVSTSLARGLVADNIASGLEWFAGFSQLMCSKEFAKSVGYEKGGLREMVDKVSWPRESDKRFVEAIHVAMHNRYGALAAQARQRGEKIPFDREFERMRTGLTRAKNEQTLRAELADLFARGGINKILQKDWQQILTLLVSRDWQRTRDLALLGLASYTGKGAEQLVPQDQENSEKEEQP